jgi:hypothetical protein
LKPDKKVIQNAKIISNLAEMTRKYKEEQKGITPWEQKDLRRVTKRTLEQYFNSNKTLQKLWETLKVNKFLTLINKCKNEDSCERRKQRFKNRLKKVINFPDSYKNVLEILVEMLMFQEVVEGGKRRKSPFKKRRTKRKKRKRTKRKKSKKRKSKRKTKKRKSKRRRKKRTRRR